MANNNSTHKQTSIITLVSECFVKPKHQTIDLPKQTYHLGPADLAFLSGDPIQKGLLFPLNDNTFVSHFLDKLKHSLSIALLHFHPLGGRFVTQVYSDEQACSIFIDCNKGGPGARFIHARALGLTVSDILSPVDVTNCHAFFDLGERYVNYDGHTKALLSIQVTELQDGVFIGFSMNHSIIDGTSFIHFVNMLSEIYRSDDCYSESNEIITQISRVPIFNYKPWLNYDPGNEKDALLKLPYVDVEKYLNRGYDPGPLRERIFHFSPTSMASLKTKANQESGDNYNVIVSSFLALSALVWRCITRARNLPLDQEVSCSFVIGARNRFDPPVSDEYFGNFICRTQWSCKVADLMSNNLGWAGINLQNLIVTQDSKAVLDQIKMFVDSPIVIPRNSETDFHGTNSVIMGGSARFNMYEPEFGLGRAVAVRMGYGNKQDGKITANPGCEGNGSVDLEICLRPHTMTMLESDEEFMSFVSLDN